MYRLALGISTCIIHLNLKFSHLLSFSLSECPSCSTQTHLKQNGILLWHGGTVAMRLEVQKTPNTG